jgi:cell division initiation protein
MNERKMPITPAELRSSQFDRKMRGYDPEQVDEVMRVAAESLEQSLLRIDSLSRDISKLEDKISDFERVESTLRDTLVETRGSVDEIKSNALREAELIKREAQVEAARDTDLHQRKIEEIKGDIEKLKNLRGDYVIKLKALINSHLEILTKVSDESDDESPGVTELSEEHVE